MFHFQIYISYRLNITEKDHNNGKEVERSAAMKQHKNDFFIVKKLKAECVTQHDMQ